MNLKPLLDAPPTREQCMAWQQKWPGTNLAVLTGRASRITVIDVDGDEGEESLLSAGITLPESPTVITGRGRHVYCNYDERLSTVAALLPGVDVRNDGGIAVVPPSMHHSGVRYRWAEGLGLADVVPAPVPESLVELTPAKRAFRASPVVADTSLLAGAIASVLTADATGIGEQCAFWFGRAEDAAARRGSRNTTLNEAAYALGGLEHLGLDREDTCDRLAALLVCPDFSQAEFDATFNSGWSAGCEAPRVGTASHARYPVDALPANMRDYVEQCADTLGVPAEMIAPGLLVFAGATAGDSYRLLLERDGDPRFGSWSERPALWAITVAGAGAGKSPALKRARIFIDALQQLADKRHVREMEHFSIEHDAWKSGRSGRGRIKKKASEPVQEAAEPTSMPIQEAFDGMGIDPPFDAPPRPASSRPSPDTVALIDYTPEPQAPPEEVFVTTDTTVEGLARALSASRGVALALDEARSWLHSLGAYNGRATGDRAKYLSMWSGEPMRVTRAKAETLSVESPVLGWIGGLQPMFAGEFILGDGLGDGLPQRLLWSVPFVSPEVTPSGVPVTEAAYRALEAVFARLRLAPEARAADLRLSPEAQPLFERLVSECRRHGLASEDQGATRRDILYAGLVAKVPAHVARLALVLHLVTHDRPAEHVVAAQTINQALRLVAFHTVCFRSVVDQALASETDASVGQISTRTDRLAEKIEDALRKADGAWLSLRDLKVQARIRDPKAVRDSALNILVDDGVAHRRERPSHTGSMTVEYRLNTETREAA